MLRFTLHLAIVAALCVAPQVQADEPIRADSVVKAEKLRLDALRAAQRGDFQVAADRIASAADLSGNSRVAEQARQLAPASNPGGGGAQRHAADRVERTGSALLLQRMQGHLRFGSSRRQQETR